MRMLTKDDGLTRKLARLMDQDHRPSENGPRSKRLRKEDRRLSVRAHALFSNDRTHLVCGQKTRMMMGCK